MDKAKRYTVVAGILLSTFLLLGGILSMLVVCWERMP